MMKKLFIFLIRLYQKYLSPLKSTKCPYFPTCSQYGLEAIQKYGALKGGLLAAWRILRCNPFCKGGYDPVPEKGLRNPKNAEIRESIEATDNITQEKEN